MTALRPRGSPLHKLDESLLTQLVPFAQLERGQIREILDQATSHRYVIGDTVFHEGDAAERFFLLLDGYIRVIRITPEGEHVIVLHVPAGQLFGIAKALGKTQYPATTIATSDSIVLSWPMRLWDDFVARYPGFGTETYHTIGNRMGEMRERLVEMATQQVEQRVANALLRLINQTGRKVEGGIEVDFPITRQDLSEMTGTTPYTVSRLLSTWEKAGLIESRRKHILVRQPHTLVSRSQQGS